MNEKQSIKDTLSIIRNALEDDKPEINKQLNDNILILDQLVKDDGTIDILKKTSLNKKDTIEILRNKLDEVFESHLSKWLDNNIPDYLEKYFKKKDI